MSLSYDPAQTPFRPDGGDREYIRTRNGQAHLARTWQPAIRKWKYTRLGIRFYSRAQTQYVVEVPVFLRGKRRDGQGQYEKKSWMPVSLMGMSGLSFPQIMDSTEAQAAIRHSVLSHMRDFERNGSYVLYEYSGEEYHYNPQGLWKISGLTTTPSDSGDGEPTVQAIMHRPLGADVMIHDDVLNPQQFIPQAFQTYPNRGCVPAQLAIVTGELLSDIEAWLDEKRPDWRDVGVTAAEASAWCETNGRSCYVIYREQVIHAFRPRRSNRKGVAFAIIGNHAYFYDRTLSVSHLPVQERLASTIKARLVTDPRPSAGDTSGWRAWNHQFAEAGHYFTRDLETARRDFFRAGINPRVAMASATRMTMLTHYLPQEADGTESDRTEEPARGPAVVVHSWPDHADFIEDFYRELNRKHNLGITWCGQGIASSTWTALKALLLAKTRGRPTPEQQEEICKAQEGRCAMCGGIIERHDPKEFDHIIPLRDLLRGQEQKYQMLCEGCHAEKTKLEPAFEKDPLKSVFSKAVYEAYVERPILPALTFHTNTPQKCGGDLHELDVRRCRRNALMYCAHPLPVFSPFDTIEACKPHTLYDLQWIDKGERRCKGPAEVMGLLPYTGPRWYPRVAAEFLLFHMKIAWDDLKLGLNASGHLPADTLAQPLQDIEDAWKAVGAEGLVAKQSINAMIGFLGYPHHSSWRLRTGDYLADMVGCVQSRTFTWGDADGQEILEHVFETKLLTNQSHRPIHDICLFTEHTRVAQLWYLLNQLQVPARSIVCLKTDAVVFQASRATLKRALDAERTTFRDLADMKWAHEPPIFGEHRKMLEPCRITPIDSDQPVFRHNPKGKLLQGAHLLPVTPGEDGEPDDAAERLASRGFLRSQAFAEVPSVEAARELVLRGESLLVLGVAGTGKTYEVKRIVQELRGAGKAVVVIAKTHAAVQNADGTCTANYFCHRFVKNGTCSADAIVVEEVSQVDAAVWADLSRLQLVHKQWIILGDFNQFGPICNHWRGTPLADDVLERSSFLRELCPNRLVLTENKRSDPRLFAWYTSLIPGGEQYDTDLRTVLSEARIAFPNRPHSDGMARYTLCLSHRHRMAVNAHCNAMARAMFPEGRLIKAPDVPRTGAPVNRPQNMWVWPGLQLIGCCRGGIGPVLNGCMYTVRAVTDTHLALDTKDGEEGPTMTHEQAARCLRLTYGLTLAGCQGLTLPGRVRIVDTNSPHFTRKHLFVGLSRATAFDLLEVD